MTQEQLTAAQDNREQYYDFATLLNHLTNDELKSITLKFKREPDFVLSHQEANLNNASKKLSKKVRKLLKQLDEEFEKI